MKKDTVPSWVFFKSGPVKFVKSPKSYLNLSQKVIGNSVVDFITREDYPVTEESVQSYAEFCDYKKDLDAAITSLAPGIPLGDITAMQEALENDMSSIKAKLNELRLAYANRRQQPDEENNEEEKKIDEKKEVDK